MAVLDDHGRHQPREGEQTVFREIPLVLEGIVSLNERRLVHHLVDSNGADAVLAVDLRLDGTIAAELLADGGLWRDFNDFCDCGGRLAGTASEKRAFALLRGNAEWEAMAYG